MLTFARVRAITVVTVLFIAAVVTAIMALSQDAEHSGAQDDCPEGFVEVDLTLPSSREVAINVYNGTNRGGLAREVGTNFANRNFEVLATGEHDGEIEGVAELRYGPQSVGAAQLVGTYFVNEATMVFDIDRTDPAIDVLLGDQFRQLATPTVVSQAIAAVGNPQPPPGTCAAG